MAVFGVLVVLLTLFYTAFLIDPEKASETLKTLGGAVRGVMPGEPTADHLDNVAVPRDAGRRRSIWLWSSSYRSC